MDSFLYWSGVAAWAIMGIVALDRVLETAIDCTIHSLWTKREFVAFVAGRMKRKTGE